MSVTESEITDEGRTDPAEARIVRFLKTQAGTDLRSVVAYDESGWDVLYAREDVQRDEFGVLVGEMKTRARSAYGNDGPSMESSPQSIVSCHDQAVVLQFVHEHPRSIAALLDADATPRIRAFTKQCLEQIAE